MKNAKSWRSVALATGVALAIAVVGAAPAIAAQSSINCSGVTETISNGYTGNYSSFARTWNTNLKCGKVGNGAYVNQNGQILWVAPNTLTSGITFSEKWFYGVISRSVHYHNGTSTTLWA